MKSDPTFWILARSSGIAAYVLLTASVLAGVVLKARPFGTSPRPAAVTDVHRLLALLGLSTLALHGVALVLDRTVEVSLAALLVPGLVPYRPLWTALPDGALKRQLFSELAGLVQLGSDALADLWAEAPGPRGAGARGANADNPPEGWDAAGYAPPPAGGGYGPDRKTWKRRDGKGPWRNAKGVVVANNVNDLHSAKNKINKQNGLDEKGQPVKGRGDTPNEHDILTGSDPMGMYSTAGGDTTCGNWTKSGEGSAIVGHFDRQGLADTRHMKSWNSSHGSAGCSQEALVKTGGAGLLYCFAAN